MQLPVEVQATEAMGVEPMGVGPMGDPMGHLLALDQLHQDAQDSMAY